MAWTTPDTFVAGQVVSASDLNEQIRDNMNYVHAGKPATVIARNNVGVYSTSSGSFANIDGTNLKATITTTTGRVALFFVGSFYADNPARLLSLDCTIDGTRWMSAYTNGMGKETLDTNARIITLAMMKTGLSVGSHEFIMQWKVGSGTAYLFSAAGDVAVNFVVAEW